MKKYLFLFLMALFAMVLPAHAETKIFSWSVSNNMDNSLSSLQAANWTLTHNSTYSGSFDPTKGIQIGSGNNPARTVTITSSTNSDFYGKKITSVKVNASTASSASATLSVKVGSETYGSKSLTTSATDYTFTGNETAGIITITYTQPSTSKALYLKSIEVTYEDTTGGGTVTPGGDEETSKTVTLNTTNFKTSGTAYAKYNYTVDDIKYTAVFAPTSGTMQFNTNNGNGKASAIVVNSNTSDYIVESIDIVFNAGSIGNGVNIYSYTQGFGDLTLGTTPSIPKEAKQIESALKADKTNIAINAPAFAIYPGGTGVIQISSVTVYYKKKAAPNPGTDPVDLTTFAYSAERAEYDLNPSVTKPVLPSLEILPADANITVTYKSSDTLVATVSEATGEVTPIATGETTITATFAGNEKYNEATASYTLTVKNSASTVEPEPGEDGDYYVLINSDKELGDKAVCLIVNTENKKAMKEVSSNGNNFQSQEVTITDKKIYLTNEETVEEVTITKEGNNYILAINGGYLAAGSSSNNYLKKDTSLTDNSRATITFSGDNVSIVFQGSYTRNWIQYNKSNDIFACYASGTTTMLPVQLYKKVSSTVEPIPTPVVPVVKIGEEVLENGKSKTVAANTKVTITCENAPQVKGTINGTNFGPENTPYPLTITEKTELSVWGFNEGVEGEEIFKYNFTVGEVDEKMPPVGSRFRQILNGMDLTDDYYVIGRHFKDDTKEVKVAMSKNTGSYANNANIQSTENIAIEPISTGSQDFDLLTVNGDDVLIVKLEKAAEEKSWYIKTVNYGDGFISSQKYIYAPNEEATALELVDDREAAYIEITDNNNANIYFTPSEKPGRTIGTPSSGAFFNYQSSRDAVQLYRYTKAHNYVPQFDDLTLRVGDKPTTIIPETESHPKISYDVSEDTTIISIKDDVITAEQAGVVNVIATWDESDEWFAGKDSFTVNVKPALKDPQLSFRYHTVYGKKDVGFVGQAVYRTSPGAITYSSSNPEVVNIDPDTGMYITGSPCNIGETTITATIEPTDEYKGDATSYIVIIEGPEEATEAVESTATFNFADPNDWNAEKTIEIPDSRNNTKNVNDVIFYGKETKDIYLVGSSSKNGATGGSAPVLAYKSVNNTNVYDLRLYGSTKTGNNNSLMISLADGVEGVITSIDFTISPTIDENTSGISCDYGKVGYNSYSKNYEQNLKISKDGVNVKSVIFTVDQNINFSKITVHVQTQKASDALDYYPMSFENDDRIINQFEGDVFEHNVPKFDKEGGEQYRSEIKYQVDDESMNRDEMEGVEIELGDNDTFTVKGLKAGVYTVRAYLNKTDDHAASTAILRLNVFPRLSVIPTSDTPEDGMLAEDERNEAPNLTLVRPDETTGNAVITLPSLDEHKDDYKYSTVTVSRVTINHGGKITIYEKKEAQADASERVAAQADEETFDILEMPSSLEFTTDGSVKYEMLYADTYHIEETVHVILMPTVKTELPDEKTLRLTPSANARLQYVTYVFNPDYPWEPEEWEVTQPSDAPRKVEGQFNGVNTIYSFDTSDEAVDITRPTDIPEDLWFTARYRSVKDLAEIIEDESARPEDTILYSEVEKLGFDPKEVVVGADSILGDADEAEVRFFNLQGIRIHKPVKGEIYIRVQGRNVEKVIF